MTLDFIFRLVLCSHEDVSFNIICLNLLVDIIELQPCLGMSWYDLDSNVARVCTNKARIYSIKQGLSRFEHDLQNDFHTIVVRLQVRSSTVCYGLVRLILFVCLLLYVPSQQLWSLRDGKFILPLFFLGKLEQASS